jgi:mono/diheme cytochrome c family protein
MRAVLALLCALLALAVVGCGGGEEARPTPETVETGGTETEPETETAGETETEPEETEPEETEPAGEADAEAGRAVFDDAGCGGCHVLEEAGSSGTIGPNLDESQPSRELVVDRVTNGSGAMPSFKDRLSEEQINDVAAFVVQATGGG